MNNFVPWVLALAVSWGAATALEIRYPAAQRGRASESLLALDGAYRDGLYVGKLAAKSGRRSHPPIGRWSSETDRASFLAGYERTYDAASSQSSYAKSDF